MSTIATQEKRELAITAYESGQGSQRQIAAMFGIDWATLKRWLVQKRKDGRTAPLPRGHNPAAFSGENLTALDVYVAAHCDASLTEIQDAFADRVSCSDVTIHNTLKRLGWVRKKSGYVRMNVTGQT